MKIRCYDIHDQTTFSAVVFAQSHADAIWIGNLHLESYRGHQSTMMTAIDRKAGPNGGAAEHLMVAIDSDIPGIGHLQSDGSWLVLPPGARPEYAVRPRRTLMHLFTDDDDYQIVLFARDEMRARNLYRVICDQLDQLPDGWLGAEWEAWTTVGLVRHQRHAEERGVEGVGIYSEQGWEILPLDYEALGIEPPDWQVERAPGITALL